MTDYNINERWSLLDRAKNVVPHYQVMKLINASEFGREVPIITANSGLFHRFSRDREMAASTNRAFYSGVGKTKMSKQVLYEHCELIERRREIDEDELDTLASDEQGKAEVLRQQDEAHITKLGEDMVYRVFNGAASSGSEYINGFQARLASLNPSGTGNGLNNVRSAGNTNASYNTSIYVVEWNLNGGAYMFVPPTGMGGTMNGVVARDKGKETQRDSSDSTLTYYVYVAQFKLWIGLVVGDNLKIARIANINSQIGASKNFDDAGVSNTLIDVLNQGHFDRSRTRIYCNQDMMSQIEVYDKDNANRTYVGGAQVFGNQVRTFRDIPIRMLDNVIIPSTETVVE